MVRHEDPGHAYRRKPPADSCVARGTPTAAARATAGPAAQLAAIHRLLNQGPAVQRRAAGDIARTQRLEDGTSASSANRTGLPDRLKTGLEALSGLSMDDVRVHRNSTKPMQLNALAYSQGADIHIAPGQDRHLPHEAWHVVQQKQGRVKPTLLAKAVPINDDVGLEREADAMGAKALAQAESRERAPRDTAGLSGARLDGERGIVQGFWVQKDKIWLWDIPVSGVRWSTDGIHYWFDIVDKEGAAFADYAGFEKRHTHQQWKALGAGDLPEAHLLFEAMHDLEKKPQEKTGPVTWGPLTMTVNGQPKGAARGLPIYNWLYGKGAKPSKMNCYEVVLFAAVEAGIRDKAYVKEMIALDPQAMAEGGPALAKRYKVTKLPDQDKEKQAALEKLLPKVIPRGEVVIFGSQGQHVALSAGTADAKGHYVLELDQKTCGVILSTVEQITEKYRSIGWGPLP